VKVISLGHIITWHVGPLLGNDQYPTAAAKQWLCKQRAVARQPLSSDHVVTPADMKATMALQQRKAVFYGVRAEIL
jgi:hypothetical protein